MAPKDHKALTAGDIPEAGRAIKVGRDHPRSVGSDGNTAILMKVRPYVVDYPCSMTEISQYVTDNVPG
jgi:hypothetical protein